MQIDLLESGSLGGTEPGIELETPELAGLLSVPLVDVAEPLRTCW